MFLTVIFFDIFFLIYFLTFLLGCAPNTLQYSCFYDSPGFCINETFFNDSIVNCPFEMDCRDEGSCLSFINGDDDDDHDDDSSMYSNIVLSAVTSLFFTFIFVIIVTWLCRKMGPACCLSCIGDQNNRTTPRPQVFLIFYVDMFCLIFFSNLTFHLNYLSCICV